MDPVAESVKDYIKRIKDKAKNNQRKYEIQMSVGIIYTVVTVWIFGRWPGYFWLYYLVSFWAFFPLQLYVRWPCYFLKEFCWWANISSNVLILMFVIATVTDSPLEDWLRNSFLTVTFSMATGAVGYAAFAQSFTFHHIPAAAEFIVHNVPTLTVYTLRWYEPEVHKAFPKIFPEGFLSTKVTCWHIIEGYLCVYLSWWLFYLLYALISGVRKSQDHADFPRKDNYLEITMNELMNGGAFPMCIAHCFVRKTCPRRLFCNDRGRPVRLTAVLVCLFHALYCIPLGGMAVLCYKYRIVHLVFSISGLGVALIQAGGRYGTTISYYEAFKNSHEALGEPESTELGRSDPLI